MSQHVRVSGNRSRQQGLLDERLRFETILSRLSTTFINLPADRIDGQIERGLQQIVEFLGIERSSLGQFSEDGSELLVTHSYTVPGFLPFPRVNLAPLWPWYTEKLRQGEVLRFTRLPDELPPEAVLERESYLRNGIRSHLALPFKVGESVLGGIGFGSFRGERDWPDDLVQSLQLVGEVFANALARKRAEEEARTVREQLAHVGRVTAMGEMVASIAHEVNQPLCAIVSNAQALQHMVASGGFDRGEASEALRDVIKDGQRASAVLARIRGFLRKAPAERARVDVNDLIREVTALTRQDMVQRGVAVSLDLAAEVPPVHGDRIQLQQVLLNLIANGADALERTPKEQRQLVVRSIEGGAGSIAVAVQDSGSGLDPGDRARVFDAFVTTKPGSLGMGLAICKSIVEAHGGRIGARPNDGPGTTFEFTLPGLPSPSGRGPGDGREGPS